MASNDSTIRFHMNINKCEITGYNSSYVTFCRHFTAIPHSQEDQVCVEIHI